MHKMGIILFTVYTQNILISLCSVHFFILMCTLISLFRLFDITVDQNLIE